ncbi:MAG: Smr/MutS family protein [Candidatus Rokubacteria bacterium]|nr:Smr/MutS family protein [Candidatus Rokubacteria bacterium]
MRAMGSRRARIRQKDLHGYHSVEEALTTFVSAYNSLVQEKRDDGLRVIHGYGSSRGSGRIKHRLHEFLRQHSDCVDDWVDGDVFQNPDITIVYPRWALPQP